MYIHEKGHQSEGIRSDIMTTFEGLNSNAMKYIQYHQLHVPKTDWTIERTNH